MTGTRKYIRERTSGGEDMLWMLGVADLVERVNRGAHLVRLECNVEVDRGAGGQVAQAHPVLRDGIPRVLQAHVVLT